MSIQWGSLLTVFVVSLGSTVAVVLLVTLALIGLSGRSAPVGPTAAHRTLFTPTAGTAMAGACLVGVAVIVLFGLWAIVAR
jgi:Zn-dependent protease